MKIKLIKKMEISKIKESALSQLLTVGMSEIEAMKEISFAIQIISTNKDLQGCSFVSIVSAIKNLGSMGLSLNPAKKECYLIKRWTRNGDEAQLMPSYVGLVNLLSKFTNVQQVISNVVHANDFFELDAASFSTPITHRPKFGERGEIIGVYAVARFEDGNFQAEFIEKEELDKIRGMSDGYKYAVKTGKNNSVWHIWANEMSRKSVLKRLCKYIPEILNNENISAAILNDNKEYSASLNQIQYIESLLMDSRAPKALFSEISGAIEGGDISSHEAKGYIMALKSHLPTEIDKLQSGEYLNSNEIGKAIEQGMAMEDFKERK